MANDAGSKSIMRKINALKQMKTELPVILANDCVNFFKESFRKQGWDDGGLQKWKKRKGNVIGGIAVISKKSKGARAILTQTGDLKNSIVVESATFSKIKIASKLPYSAIHNTGGTIKHPGGTPYIIGANKLAIFMKKDGSYPSGTKFTGPHDIKMPKRKFMGNSRTLTNKLKKKIEDKLNIAFRK